MMTVGDDDHCADAVTGSAKTAAADNAERTLVIIMTSNSNHTPRRRSHPGASAPPIASSPINKSLILVKTNEIAKLIPKDEARRIAANVVKLPKRLRRQK
jgi:hypothetical protein